MILSDAGKIVDEIWSEMFRWAEDAQTWIIMPNHLHGVVAISDADETARRPSATSIKDHVLEDVCTISNLQACFDRHLDREPPVTVEP